MRIDIRGLLFFALISAATSALAQEQNKEQSKLYMEQFELTMAETKAIDDARELIVMAANFDTTNIKANFEAGHTYLITINKEQAVKFFLRIYRQSPNYRFDLEYWIGNAYQYGLKFDNAINFYSLYKDKLSKKAGYAGKDKIEMKEVDRRLAECANGKEFVASPKPFAITNIGREINSEFEDYAPVLSPDENEIIFTTRRRDGNTFENVALDNKPYEDIFVADKSGGAWQKAKNIGPPLNTKYSDSNLTLSPDGKTLFIYRDEGNGDIFESVKGADGKWSEPKPLPGIINSSYRESSVSITPDGNTLYFASERPGGFGGSDIYIATKGSNNQWSRVKNAGTMINTEYDEDGPFIVADTKTLYFSSKGRKGMGGYDIFKTELLNAEKMEWSEPENIGYPINSPDDDIYFVTSKDGKHWYYSTVRDDGMGYTDIYIITPVEEPKKAPEVAAKEPVKEEPKVEEPKKEEPKKEEPKPEPVKEKPQVQPLKYVVTVVDADTKTPLEAKVKMQSSKEKTMVGAKEIGNGAVEFSVTTSTAKNYTLSVEMEGYVFQTLTEKIAGATTEPQTVNKTIAMRKLVVGTVSILRNIYFDFAKASFKTESYGELNKLEAMMRQNQSLQVEIAGHTDFVGTKQFNKNLSQLRANAVKNYLVNKGIDTRRVKAVGYGEDKPLASNDDEKEGRELNRRVEFRVLGN
ncbi:MAG: PD40 domain-containing protein [Bacteroidetes bacterium]|nr:PD40 domain-containing protein [Bacteroidota bacterium]MBS1541553.1 PD40 domain-containing protein [Bacteroidota bacterium]